MKNIIIDVKNSIDGHDGSQGVHRLEGGSKEIIQNAAQKNKGRENTNKRLRVKRRP